MIISWQVYPAVIAALVLAWGIHSLDVWRLESNWEDEKQAAVLAEIKKCTDNKKITSDSEKSYEDKIAVRDADIKRLSKRPAFCVPITKPANSGNATHVVGKSDSGNGVDSNSLYNFASDCETDRIKVLTLQDFINQVWKANGQSN